MKFRILKDFLIYGFASYGILWTVAESFGAFFDDLKPEGVFWYSVIIVISILIGLYKALPRNQVEIKIPNTDSSFIVTFGDIFNDSDAVVIPVNEFFDGRLGNNVSEKSLHGKFVKNIFDGDSSKFNQLTNKTLKNIESKEIIRSTGRKHQYPIGTTAIIDVNNTRYFLTVLSKTDTDTLKASATIHELWVCFEGMWKAIYNHSNGYTVKIPLIGSGLSGIGLPPERLLDQILTSFFYYIKKQKISDKVVFVLPENMKAEIDLLSIKRKWNHGLS